MCRSRFASKLSTLVKNSWRFMRSIWPPHLSGSSICAATTSLTPNLGASVNGDLVLLAQHDQRAEVPLGELLRDPCFFARAVPRVEVPQDDQPHRSLSSPAIIDRHTVALGPRLSALRV